MSRSLFPALVLRHKATTCFLAFFFLLFLFGFLMWKRSLRRQRTVFRPKNTQKKKGIWSSCKRYNKRCKYCNTLDICFCSVYFPLYVLLIFFPLERLWARVSFSPWGQSRCDLLPTPLADIYIVFEVEGKNRRFPSQWENVRSHANNGIHASALFCIFFSRLYLTRCARTIFTMIRLFICDSWAWLAEKKKEQAKICTSVAFSCVFGTFWTARRQFSSRQRHDIHNLLRHSCRFLN